MTEDREGVHYIGTVSRKITCRDRKTSKRRRHEMTVHKPTLVARYEGQDPIIAYEQQSRG